MTKIMKLQAIVIGCFIGISTCVSLYFYDLGRMHGDIDATKECTQILRDVREWMINNVEE